MKFYRLSDDYVSYLKNLEEKVQDNYIERKPYVGVVMTINLHNYFAPMSSYKPKQDRISNDTVFKLRSRTDPNDKLGVIHLNNMVPAPLTELEEIVFKNEEPTYGNMMLKQYQYITSKKVEINQQAQRLHHRVVDRQETFYVNLSCDFAMLEKEYLKYK